MMCEDTKIYLVETKEDYDDLMVELENQGYRWFGGGLPTHFPNNWDFYKSKSCIVVSKQTKTTIVRGLDTVKDEYQGIRIVKHKAKGERKMEKVKVSQCVADWYEEYKSNSLYTTLDRFLNNLGTSLELTQWQNSFGKSFEENLNIAQDIIAKMHLYDYEVEEKKYYWRKKKEYMFKFEEVKYSYMNYDYNTRIFLFSTSEDTDTMRTKFTESEIKELVGDDINKLEKVEIT